MRHTKLIYSEIQKKRLTEAEAAASANRLPVIAILEDIRSLYNVGSIFRTSDGAHLEAIYTVGYTPHPPRKEIEKTALGATRTVPHRHFDTIEAAVEAARAPVETRHRRVSDHASRSVSPPDSATIETRRWRVSTKIAALEITQNSRSIFDLVNDDFPLALIIGNEITGVSERALSLCDFTLEIPMLGAKHSLNVAVAFGIAAFECVRIIGHGLD